ncbi:MAG: hypothetical protein ACRCY5_03780 [Phocaeicola sp.]
MLLVLYSHATPVAQMYNGCRTSVQRLSHGCTTLFLSENKEGFLYQLQKNQPTFFSDYPF